MTPSSTNVQPKRYALIRRDITDTRDECILLETDDPGAVLVAAMNASEDAAYPDGNTVMIRDRLLERERSVCVCVSDSVKRDAALRKKGQSTGWEWEDIGLPLRSISELQPMSEILARLREYCDARTRIRARIVEKVRAASDGETIELTREEALALGIQIPTSPTPTPCPTPCPTLCPQPVENL